jgi:glycosyltransferase involved in cell wall biosynthesis
MPLKLSIVVPCHNEEPNIAPLYARLRRVLENDDFEIIFVDDGSTDGSLERIRSLRKADPRVRFVSFLTNYGHQNALMAGLRACRYDLAVSMDGDLQHPPEYIPAFVAQQKSSGAEIVMGRRKNPQKGLLKNWFSEGFSALFSRTTGVPLLSGVSDFRLYTRKSLDLLSATKDRDPFLRGMISHLKLPSTVVDYEMEDRQRGVPTYTVRKSARMAFQALLRFSNFPVRAAIFLGLTVGTFSVGEAIHFIWARLFTDTVVRGQAELMVLLGVLGSVILLLLSLLCHHTRQILDYLRNEPAYVIREETAVAAESSGPVGRKQAA